MATIDEVLTLWQAVNVSEISEEVITENSDAIIKANQEQMYEGQNAEGRKIGYYHSRYYAELKHSMNPLPPFRIPDLHFTGAFYAGMRLSLVTSNSVEITSTDSKVDDLVDKYGGEIFGLMEGRADEVQEDTLLPAFLEKLRAKVGI